MDANDEAGDLTIVNGYIATMDDELGDVGRGYITARQGVITAVAPGDPPSTAEEAQLIDARGGLVHPGFIDGHAHVGWGLLRCVTPLGLTAHQSFEDYERPLVDAMEDEDEYLGALLVCSEMALSGTTCYSDTGSAINGLTPITAATEAVGLRGMISHFCADEVPALRRVNRSTRECARLLERGLAEFPREPGRLVWACAGLLGGGAITQELLKTAKQIAREHGAVLNMHYSFDREQVRSQGGAPDRQMEQLDALGVLDSSTSLVHMNVMSSPDMAHLVAASAPVVHCPAATAFYGLGSEQRPLPFGALRRSGGVVALGTDSTLFPNSWSLTRQAGLAALLQRDGTRAGAAAISELLHMMTVGGARAVGRDDIGVLVPGKSADLVIHRSNVGEQAAAADPLAAMIFSSGTSVRDVYVAGRAIVRNGQLMFVRQEDVWREAAIASRRLRIRAGLPRFDGPESATMATMPPLQ